MIRRLLIPLLGSGLLLAATAGSAFAKCEGPNPPEFCKDVAVNLNIGGGGGTLQAGTRETITIDVSLGEQPYDATSVVLTFARVADGDAVVVTAEPSVRPGLWTADVLLTDGGSWTVVANVTAPDGTSNMIPFNTMQVRNAPNLPPVNTPVTPPPTTPAAPISPILPVGLGLAALAAAALLGQGMRERSKRRAAEGVAATVGSAATADRA